MVRAHVERSTDSRRSPQIARRRLLGLSLALSLAWLAGCTGGRGQNPPALVVGAASDLQPALTDIAAAFEEETGTKVTLQFGSSGALARQIEQGAPIDLFASAAEEDVLDLVAKGAAVAGTQRLYARGRLALVRHRGSAARADSLDDLTRQEVRRLAIANPEHAPYGRAAREALENAGIWDRVKNKVVHGETVRQALQFVATGNAEAGIVALSLAGVPEVEAKIVDDSLYTLLKQTLVVVSGSKNEAEARAFATFLGGPKGGAVMSRYGFLPPDGSWK